LHYRLRSVPDSGVCSTPANFNGFRVLASLLHRRRSTEVNKTAGCLAIFWAGLKITEHIEYKPRSLTYKVLTTTQTPYLHHLMSVQPPRSTRSSSLVTLARPPTSSSLRISDRSFRYASPCLWNQLPSSLRQPHFSPSVSALPVHAPTTSSHSVNSPLSPSTTGEWLDILWCSVCLSLTFVTFFVKKYFF